MYSIFSLTNFDNETTVSLLKINVFGDLFLYERRFCMRLVNGNTIDV